MAKTERKDIARFVATAGLRFQPGGAEVTDDDKGSDGPINVQALLDRLAELNNAPRKRVLRHTILTAPELFPELG